MSIYQSLPMLNRKQLIHYISPMILSTEHRRLVRFPKCELRASSLASSGAQTRAASWRSCGGGGEGKPPPKLDFNYYVFHLNMQCHAQLGCGGCWVKIVQNICCKAPTIFFFMWVLASISRLNLFVFPLSLCSMYVELQEKQAFADLVLKRLVERRENDLISQWRAHSW